MLGKEEILFDKAEEIYENAFSPKQLLLSEKFNLQPMGVVMHIEEARFVFV